MKIQSSVNIINKDAKWITVLAGFKKKVDLGLNVKYNYQLQILNGTTPTFHKALRIPYALVSKIEQEWEFFEANSIIEKSDLDDLSACGSPL